MAEARACERAILFAMEMGFRSVHVEGDTLTTIKQLQSNQEDKSIIGPIIGDIKVLIESFHQVTFGFVRRSANMAAHELASLGREYTDPRLWVEEAPLPVLQESTSDWERWISQRGRSLSLLCVVEN